MRIVFNIIPYFLRKLGNVSQELSSFAVVIGALRVKNFNACRKRLFHNCFFLSLSLKWLYCIDLEIICFNMTLF